MGIGLKCWILFGKMWLLLKYNVLGGWLGWEGEDSRKAIKVGYLDQSNLSLCKFCGTSIEEVNHLLVSCIKAWKVWSACMRWWVFDRFLLHP